MRWLAVLALLLAGPRAAFALDGDPEPTRVTGRLAGTSVELTARFEVALDDGSMMFGLPLTIPEHALVTGAAVTADGKRHVLGISDAAEAEKEMEAFWAEDAPINKRWTVRISGGAGMVTVDVIAPKLGARATIDLTVELPGCFYKDRRYALLPKDWSKHFAMKQPGDKDLDLIDTCAVNSVTEDHEWISFASGVLVTRPAGEARVGVFAGRLPLDHADVARVEIDLAAELTRVPLDLHTAIVLDHSRSLSGDEVENERAVVASYLQHVPAQTRVQVIAYARDAKALLPAWLPAATARARLDREIRSLAPRNGSNVDLAIAEAGRWLAREKGTRRLIVISDDRFASRIEGMQGSELKALLPEGTLVHVVVVSGGSSGLEPTDRTELGGIAELTEGISVTAGVDDKSQLDASMLVRPLGIDRVSIKGRGWEDLGITTCPREFESIDEGTACTWWAKGTSVSGAITVEAFLWGHKIKRTLFPDATSARHLARELSAGEHFFDEDLRARIDRAAFAVNAAWSLIARWGGTPGRADGGGFGFGRSGWSDCCGSVTDTIGGIGHGSLRPPVDVKAQVAPIVDRCNRRGPIKIWLGLTREEIVDVNVEATADTTDVRTCIEEGLWDLALSIPTAPWSSSASVRFDAP